MAYSTNANAIATRPILATYIVLKSNIRLHSLVFDVENNIDLLSFSRLRSFSYGHISLECSERISDRNSKRMFKRTILGLWRPFLMFVE